MFGVITLDNQTYLIVKKECISETGFLRPGSMPVEVYGFIYKQIYQDKALCSIVTDKILTTEEQQALIEETLDESKALFKDKI